MLAYRSEPISWFSYEGDEYILLMRFFLRYNPAMDFAYAVKTTNNLLARNPPHKFDRAWVRMKIPAVYRFIQRHLRLKNGGIDWDSFTRALNPKFQNQWIGSVRKTVRPYRNRAEVDCILRHYSDKLYTFLALRESTDEHMRDIICITLVRLAQKGNIAARQEITKQMSFTIDDWIERNPDLYAWRGYEELTRTRLECCIRRYRYSGSFIRYVFKSLQYAARGLRPLFAYSLDDSSRWDKR